MRVERGGGPMQAVWRAAHRLRLVGLGLALATLVTSCTTVLQRNGVPEAYLGDVLPYGIDAPLIRTWGDSLDEAERAKILEAYVARLRKVWADDIAAGRSIEEVTIAFSGGGPDGAFGAGLMNGWTARGDRPEFTIVTGISTGAIVGLFAFLGPDYDDALEAIYTTYSTDRLLTRAFFAALLGGTAVTDTSGFRRLIETYIDDQVVERLAEAQSKGRTLLIGTTNLDATRPVIWNLTMLAATRHPAAKRLIHDIIEASSAIPAVFPPVLIPVEAANGRRYDEMHVDGGATQQVMFFSPEFSVRYIDRALGVSLNRKIYVVMNNKLERPYEPVRPRVLAIASTAMSSLIRGSGSGDIFRIFTVAQRDGIDLKVTWIPAEFDIEPTELFDPVYMRALFDLGYKSGVAADHWSELPPHFISTP